MPPTSHEIHEPHIDRVALAAQVDREHGPFDPVHLRALVRVPRELFVRPEEIHLSSEDRPLALDEHALATISAPHAYLLSFRLLDLKEGDHLIELGSGTGYGAALASVIVGHQGSVLTCEIDPILAEKATYLLRSYPNVTVVCANAMAPTDKWKNASKVVATFAVNRLPKEWLALLPIGGILVAPVGNESAQHLVRAIRSPDGVHFSEHGSVRYVRNRSLQQ